jgi:isopenicillin N synthase-like dioxygenase
MTVQTSETQSIDAMLRERGSRYGVFTGHALITQNIKEALKDSPNWYALAPDQKEALEMIAHKMGRILNGDPDYLDSWVDIVGYTQLVIDRLKGDPK